MKLIAASAALLLPFVAHGAESGHAVDFILTIEYWGTVDHVTRGSANVGDAVHGTMVVHSAFAPPDLRATNPNEGDYLWNSPCDRQCPPRIPAPSGFVTNDRSSFKGTSDDEVLVIDRDKDPGRADWFLVADRESTVHGSGVGAYSDTHSVAVQIGSTVDFIMGEGLLQSFDLRPDASTIARQGGIFDQVHGVIQNSLTFVVERLRVTPKVCRA
jgi:hypothetical protein